MFVLIDALLTVIIAPADPSSVFEVLTVPGVLAAAITALSALAGWAFSYLLSRLERMQDQMDEEVSALQKSIRSTRRYVHNQREDDRDESRERIHQLEITVSGLATKEDLNAVQEKLLMHIQANQQNRGNQGYETRS